MLVPGGCLSIVSAVFMRGETCYYTGYILVVHARFGDSCTPFGEQTINIINILIHLESFAVE